MPHIRGCVCGDDHHVEGFRLQRLLQQRWRVDDAHAMANELEQGPEPLLAEKVCHARRLRVGEDGRRMGGCVGLAVLQRAADQEELVAAGVKDRRRSNKTREDADAEE